MADDWNDDDFDTDVDSSEPCYDCGGHFCESCGVCHYCNGDELDYDDTEDD